MYTGTVVLESLEDTNILDKVEIVSVTTTNDENEADRWHMYTCQVNRDIIEQFASVMRPGWYCHFWNTKELIIVFRNKRFYCDRDDPASINPAIEYGTAQGIPGEQLDFLIVE